MGGQVRGIVVLWWAVATVTLFMIAGATVGAVSLAGLAAFTFWSWRYDRKQGTAAVLNFFLAGAVLGIIALGLYLLQRLTS